MSILIHESLITDLLSNPALKKSDARTILFLLHKPGALSSDELAAGVGVSKKSASKSIKRLTAAGLIQPGEFQAKRRTLDISSLEQMEPKEVTEGTIKESLETLAEKVGRLESVIGSLTTALEAVSNPASSYDGQNMTGTGHIQATSNPDSIPDVIEQGTKVTRTVTIQAIEETAENTQAEMMPVSDSERTKAVSVITGKDTNGTTDDTIVSDLDDAIKYAGARLAAVKAASFNQEKQKQLQDTCAPARADDTFRDLFGVNVPVGFTDMAAVETMVSRKKAGKLDNVKSPLAYLSSLAGKVTPKLATLAELKTSPMGSVIQAPTLVTETRLSHADIARIDSIWDAMMDKTAYETKALAKDQTGKKYPVPVELLARSIFNAEMMAAQGGIQ